MLKRLARSALVQRLIVAFVAFYIRFVWLTSRVERVWDPESEKLLRTGQAFIAAFWHSRILLMPYHWPQGQKTHDWVHVLISRHRDGAMIARAVRSFKITAISGSSRRGGWEALQAMIRLLRAGKIVALTPDGPKGPRQRAKLGIAHAARATGVPVIPITYSVKRRRILDSWDRFLLAWPFNRILLHAAAPVETAGMSLEAAREAIEAAMNEQLDAADAHFGHPPLPPAPPLEVESRAGAASEGG